MRAAMFAAVLPVVFAGCYDPAIPSGGYRCSSVDNGCPSGQRCECGLCVSQANQAACSVDVAADSSASTVTEHQKFSITLTARAADGSVASGFNGNVDLAFLLEDGARWADVRPPTAMLTGGKAQLMVSLNRETIPPQTPKLVAQLAGAVVGQSPGITVIAPTFLRDQAEITVQPNWATGQGALPSVVPDGSGGQRMYFLAVDKGASSGVVVGAASSTNGTTFTPGVASIFPPASSALAGHTVDRGWPYQDASGYKLAASVESGDVNSQIAGDIWIGHSSDGVSAFTLPGSQPGLKRSDCASYCDTAVWLPNVIPAPAPTTDGGAGGWLMFFGAAHCGVGPGACDQLDKVSMSIGRAHSTDGETFTPEPAPILSGEQGGEAYLIAPSVILDGSIYKMWYAFARSLPNGNPCNASVVGGYATSSDGFYWVRSPSNPVLDVPAAGATGWDKNASGVVPSAVVPLDGKDPESGLAIYYSIFTNLLVVCLPNGVGRAVAYPK